MKIESLNKWLERISTELYQAALDITDVPSWVDYEYIVDNVTFLYPMRQYRIDVKGLDNPDNILTVASYIKNMLRNQLETCVYIYHTPLVLNEYTDVVTDEVVLSIEFSGRFISKDELKANREGIVLLDRLDKCRK